MSRAEDAMIAAWHFVGETLRDGRPVPEDGVWLEHAGPVVMCKSGLHASVDVWDALEYAPGGTLCLVWMDGDIEHQSDKLVARRRQIVARVDLTDALRRFTREEAKRVLHLWDAPQVVRDYLATGDETIRDAAGEAAWTTASVAARAAAWTTAMATVVDAAMATAMATAVNTAWDAAEDTAMAAARAEASVAARDVARAAAGARFRALVDSSHDWPEMVP